MSMETKDRKGSSESPLLQSKEKLLHLSDFPNHSSVQTSQDAAIGAKAHF